MVNCFFSTFRNVAWKDNVDNLTVFFVFGFISIGYMSIVLWWVLLYPISKPWSFFIWVILKTNMELRDHTLTSFMCIHRRRGRIHSLCRCRCIRKKKRTTTAFAWEGRYRTICVQTSIHDDWWRVGLRLAKTIFFLTPLEFTIFLIHYT